MNFRPERVGKLIREELANMILREVDLPPSALATVTAVEVDKSLEHAKVDVSVIPSDRRTEDAVIGALRASSGRLQHLLLKKINIKPMPQIFFVIDHGYENAAHVEKLLEGDALGGELGPEPGREPKSEEE